MPFGDYNIRKTIKKVQRSRKSGPTHEMIKQKMDHEMLEQEHKVVKSKLKIHEDREKRRLEGLKKAQQKKKSSSRVKGKTMKAKGGK